MIRYIVSSIAGGSLFAILDGLINGNPLAASLYEAYRPIERTTINLWAGILIDLIYGFVIAGIFLLVYRSLPGQFGLVKGLSFGLIIWFFRVVMDVASTWMMFTIPIKTLFYTLATGMAEMLILGLFFGAVLKPANQEPMN